MRRNKLWVLLLLLCLPTLRAVAGEPSLAERRDLAGV